MCEFARKRIKYCSLSLVCLLLLVALLLVVNVVCFLDQVSCRLTQIVLWVLRLVPSSKPSHHSYGMRSSASNNNVSEWHSLFKEAAVSALESNAASADVNVDGEYIQIDNTNSNVVETDYESKMFECSNTYNVKEDGDTEVEGDVEATIEEGVQTGKEEADFILDEPVELDTEDEDIDVLEAGPDPDSSAGEGDDVFNVDDGVRSFLKHPSIGSSLCSGGRSASAPQILPPKMLAQEPSWALLSSEKCIQVYCAN